MQKTFGRGINLYRQIMVDGTPLPDGFVVVGSNGDGTPAVADATGLGGGSNSSGSFPVTSWSGPTSGQYTATITAATHGLGTKVIVDAVLVTATGQQAWVDATIDGSGNVTLSVSETPDERENLTVVLRAYA